MEDDYSFYCSLDSNVLEVLHNKRTSTYINKYTSISMQSNDNTLKLMISVVLRKRVVVNRNTRGFCPASSSFVSFSVKKDTCY